MVAVTIASTHCTYPRRDGQAELAWVAGYVVRQFTYLKAVTHPSTNWAQCRATALIETNALLLHQITTHSHATNVIQFITSMPCVNLPVSTACCFEEAKAINHAEKGPSTTDAYSSALQHSGLLFCGHGVFRQSAATRNLVPNSKQMCNRK